jgi:peptide/nickel transport system permease protein
MWAYAIRRLAWGIPIIFGATLLVFVGLHVIKGSPAAAHLGKAASKEDLAQFEKQHGLDQNVFVQYGRYLKQIVTFDFGHSWKTNEKVSSMLWRGAGPSVSLTLPALIFTSVISIIIGIFASFFRGRAADRGLMAMAVLGMSISFLVYIVVFQYLFAFKVPLFQIHGYEPTFVDRWQFLALPIVIMVIVGMGYDSRFYRSVFVEEISNDYVTTAYAKGASRWRVLFIHVLKNAMIPIVSRVMISVPFLVTGSLLLETFFGIPGIGSMLLEAVMQDDFPVIKAATVLISILFVLSTILNDILYAVVDPRVRLD